MNTTDVGKLKIKHGDKVIEAKVVSVYEGQQKRLPKITKADPRNLGKAKPKTVTSQASLATTLENAKTKT
jgi:hypothetical protein